MSTLVSKVRPGALTAGVALAVVALWGTQVDLFLQGQLTLVMIYTIAIAGLNVLVGYTGLISVGHSAFLGIGAYVTGVMVVQLELDPISTFPVAMLLGLAVGMIVGLPALRIKGLYLATVTLALGIAFPEIVGQFEELTGGAAGLQISRTLLLPPVWSGLAVNQKSLWLYLVCLVVLVAVTVLLHLLVSSRYGLAMRAVRDNELAAASAGVNVGLLKVSVFGLSGAVTSLGGCLFAMYIGSLSPTGSFSLHMAIVLITGLVVGGQGTRLGPLVGGFIVVYLPYYASNLGAGQLSAVIFGVVLIAIVFVMPEGIVGGLARLARHLRARRDQPNDSGGSAPPGASSATPVLQPAGFGDTTLPQPTPGK